MQARYRFRWTHLLAPSAGILMTVSPARADYPIMSHRYLADPGSLVYDGRVYLYNSNDDDNNGGYHMRSVVCVSSVDMKNWTDHGIVLQVPADAKWAANTWAPQAIARDKKIFLYFGNNGSGIGVASSDDPVKGFRDARDSALINGSTPGANGTNSWLFDPGALIDDDGQAYLSFGGNGVNNGRIIKLGSDLASVSGSAVGVSTTSFFEASFLFKRKGVYYFSFSTNPANEMRIDYLTSSNPMTGYTYGGIVGAQPPDNGNNNHASQFEFKGQWYHAYHNRIVANTAKIDAEFKRNIAIEELNFDDTTGKIKQVTYTKDGVKQVGTLNPYVRVEAETMNAQNGIETEACTQGGMNVTQIGNGDWIRVRGVDFGTEGASSFTARVASATGGGKIELRLGTTTGTLVGTCEVASTSGAQTWADAKCNVTGAKGVSDLYFMFSGSAFNFDYWQFTPVGGVPIGTGGTGGVPTTGGTSGVPTTGGTTGTPTTGGTTGAPATGGTTGTPTTGGSTGLGGTTSGSTPLSTGGAPSDGGTVGSGGTSGSATSNPPVTGGTANLTGGQSNRAGGPSSGGSAAGGTDPGSSTTDGEDTSGGDSSEEGCGCRVATRSSGKTLGSALALLGLLLVRPSRRRTMQK